MIFLTFPNFLRLYVLSHWATCEATLIIALCPTCCERKIVKRQKIEKFYENDSIENFILLFIYFLTVPVAKNCHTYAEIISF